MNPTNPVNISVDKSGHITINSEIFDTNVTVDAEWATLISSIKHWLEEKFTTHKYVKLNVGDGEVFVKISELSRKLNVTDKEFMDAYKDAHGSVAKILAHFKCEETFNKLHDYYLRTYPQQLDAQVAHDKELESLKEIVRLAFLVMARSSPAKAKDLYVELPINKRRIVVIDSPEALHIRGLFGKKIG